MSKRIYWQSVKRWWKELVGSGVAITGISIFLMLSMMGAIDITGHSGDMRCAGTLEDPCVALINFTAKEDIFMYPMGYDPWGRNTVLQFDKPVKDWKMYRSWGNGWREIPLDKACTGTWCGLSNSDDERKFAYAFREGRDYQIKIEALKENPTDTIKWAINWEDKEYLDPAWEGINYKFGVEVIGDKAVWETDKGRIENTYQVSGFSAEIDLKLTSNISSQDIRGCWVFPEKLQGASARLNGTWNRDIQVNDYGNVTHSYTCNSSNFSYTLDPNYLWCYDETNGSLVWEGSFESGDLAEQTVYWNEWEVIGSHTEQESYDGFKDVSSDFSYQEVDVPIFEGTEHLYCADKYVEQGEEVWLKADMKRSSWLHLPSTKDLPTMKYWSCFWRASDTPQEAWDSGNIVCVDPYWDDTPRVPIDYEKGTNTWGGYEMDNSSVYTFDEINVLTGWNVWVNYSDPAGGTFEYRKDCLDYGGYCKYIGDQSDAKRVHNISNLTDVDQLKNYTVEFDMYVPEDGDKVNTTAVYFMQHNRTGIDQGGTYILYNPSGSFDKLFNRQKDGTWHDISNSNFTSITKAEWHSFVINQTWNPYSLDWYADGVHIGHDSNTDYRHTLQNVILRSGGWGNPADAYFGDIAIFNGSIETNAAPSIESLNCTNGTDWKESFDWNEPVETCQVTCSDDDGDPLFVNFTGTKGVTDFDAHNSSHDVWFQETKNDTGTNHFSITDLVPNSMNESGDWNVTAICYDDSFESNGTSIQWTVPFGAVSVVLNYPDEDLSVKNGSQIEDVSATATCNGGECYNVSLYFDPILRKIDEWIG